MTLLMRRATPSTPLSRMAGHRLGVLWAAGCFVVGWPGRVIRARRVLGQLAGLDDHALRDIGLTRQDLRDATALKPDRDPSILLKTRATERRRPARRS